MKIITLLFLILTATVALAGETNNIIPNGVAVTSVPNCNGSEAEGIATYSRTLANGWGYAVDTNGNTVFRATYTNSTHVNIQAFGKGGDNYCSTSNSVTIPNPPRSTKYRFTLFFTDPNDVPSGTNLCPLQVINFNP